MKKIKKLLISSVVGILLLLSVTGCSEKIVYVKPDLPILKEYRIPRLDGITYEVREARGIK